MRNEENLERKKRRGTAEIKDGNYCLPLNKMSRVAPKKEKKKKKPCFQ